MNKWIHPAKCLMSLGLGVALSAPVFAAPGIFYPQPEVNQATAEDAARSCIDLEREVASLQPMTYSYKPGFYEDPYHGAALFGGIFYSSPYPIAYLGYSYYVSWDDARRIRHANRRIEELRGLKARKHCFES